MDFKNLVKYIKSQGCAVTVYKSKHKVDSCRGYFLQDPPHIKIATKKRSKNQIMSILLHEYGHFLQWRDGFLGFFDAIGDAHETFDQWWQKKIELNDNEIRMYRNIMLAVEYDAEVRSYNVGKELLVKDFNPEKHLQEAYSYIASIKWAWENRMEWSDRPEYDKWPAKLLTQEELFAPLTDEENKILKLIVPAA